MNTITPITGKKKITKMQKSLFPSDKPKRSISLQDLNKVFH